MSVLRLIPTIGQIVEISSSPATVGRDPISDLVIVDEFVSRRHARMRHTGRVWVVEDSGSTNGTFVNGIGVSSMALTNGDNLRFGLHAEFEIGLVHQSATTTPTPQPTPARQATQGMMGTHRLSRRSLSAFLSYSSVDRALVDAVASRLSRAGVDVWLDKQRLHGGQEWPEALTDALGGADVFLACVTPQYVAGQGYFQAELRRARLRAEQMPEGAIFIVPVVLVRCELPRSLQQLHPVYPFAPGGWERLIEALAHRAEQLGVATPRLAA